MIEAREGGDLERATERAIRMKTIGEMIGDQEKVEMAERFIETDVDTGVVRPKTDVDPIDEIEAMTMSVKTNRTKRSES
jgi:hypothetical protein